MKSGNGSSSPNEDASRYQPFAQFLPAKSKYKSNSSLHQYETAAHRADGHTHIHMGRMSRAGDVSGQLKWYYVGQQVGRGGAGFSDDMLSSCSRDR
jgi:hypothetical protein